MTLQQMPQVAQPAESFTSGAGGFGALGQIPLAQLLGALGGGFIGNALGGNVGNQIGSILGGGLATAGNNNLLQSGGLAGGLNDLFSVRGSQPTNPLYAAVGDTMAPLAPLSVANPLERVLSGF